MELTDSGKEKYMKVAILTQPLHVNYGGLLQAYALSKTLQSLNCKVTVVNRRRSQILSKRKILSVAIKNIIKRYLFHRDVKEIVPYFLSEYEYQTISQHTRQFVEKYITRSEDIFNTEQLKTFCLGNFDAYVVGSDQVWRLRYSPCISNYFLDFVPSDSKAKKISYAASFGIDHLEYSAEQVSMYKPLIKKFDALSVREDSAVRLCKEHFEVNAEHVLDPTMLLTKEDYSILLDDRKNCIGELFVYILDMNYAEKVLMEKIEKMLGLRSFSIKSKTLNHQTCKDIRNCIVPPVEDWILAFRDAEFIMTDSFHGCVFSIIFNKPFLAIGNKQRGLARFKSLLSMFGLDDRLIHSVEDLSDEKMFESINWNRVNIILEKQSKKSFCFLKTNLFFGGE